MYWRQYARKYPGSAAEVNAGWVENTQTQPVPAQASKTRLRLPYANEELMLNGAPIVGFGAHAGQHIEGLDHVWIPIKAKAAARAWGDGRVTRVEEIGYQGEEFMVTINYGGGLTCVNGELSSATVKPRQEVRYGDPIGTARDFYGFPEVNEIELYCFDTKRAVGTITSNGERAIAVSPFDYLEDNDRGRLAKLYEEKVIKPYLTAKKGPGADWSPVEPWLTNKIMVHEPNKITGEWFLINQRYNGKDVSLMAFLEAKNTYYSGNAFRMRAETYENFEVKLYIDGDYDATYEGNKGALVLHDRRDKQTYYALFEVLEEAGRDINGQPRAQLKFEWGKKPITAFSDKARLYQERGLINPRNEAAQLGDWIKVQ